MKKIRRNSGTIFLLVLCGVVVVIWYSIFHFEGRQHLLVTFFDVGQGDAIFIEVPNGNQILIDGGPGDRILSKLGKRMPFWDRSIDLLILTHPHADHLDGLLEVLKRYEVDIVMESGIPHSIPEYQEWRELLEKKRVRVIAAREGQNIDMGRGVTLDILAPFENFVAASSPGAHDAMVVSRLKHGNNSILLMGDAERSIEYRLLWGVPGALDSDMLKIGHHGSKTSTSEEFLQAVSPDLAVIQVGRKNRYGHPAQEVLDRLAAAGVRVLRNDRDRDITFVSDGGRWQRQR